MLNGWYFCLGKCMFPHLPERMSQVEEAVSPHFQASTYGVPIDN
jgi:hypothetical protein